MTREQLIERNKQVLRKYIPEKAIERISEMILEYDFKLIIKGDRRSKWGDFRASYGDRNYSTITINKSLNPYSFLITLVHEIAHCKTYREFGNKVDAHGREWKKNFQILMQHFLNTDVFPIDVLYVLRKHLQNPLASANADVELYKVLMNYDSKEKVVLLEYLSDGQKFIFEENLYQRIGLVRKRIECVQLSTNKKYLFSPIVEVELVEE
ncbi:MAG: metallopeptidase [Bacteroidia bacterium]|nr:MAG: metallopeptidase [Bacteroidia bacterium]